MTENPYKSRQSKRSEVRMQANTGTNLKGKRNGVKLLSGEEESKIDFNINQMNIS